MTDEELAIFKNLVEDTVRFSLDVANSTATITYSTAIRFCQSLGVARELLQRLEGEWEE
jgi:hypothetical protein